MFLYYFSQRNVSALVMSHLQVDHFFSKVNHTIINAIVTYQISYNIYEIEVTLIALCNSIELIYCKQASQPAYIYIYMNYQRPTLTVTIKSRAF